MKENQSIEFKQNWREEYLKWICGFANATGGKLFLGKDDAGNTTGIHDYKKLMDDLPNIIRNYLGITTDVNLIKENEKYLIEIDVKPQTVAISLRGRYYKRIGSVNTELTGNNLNEFLLQKSGRTWDDVIEERATLNDIDKKSLNRFIKIGETTNRLPDVAGLKTSEILEKLRLIEKGNLKRAALILFGKDPGKFYPNLSVKIGRFGKNDEDLLYEAVEEGHLFILLQNVLTQLNRKFFKNPIEFGGLQRIEKGEYPVAAIREMLLNALVHKSYLGAAIQIRIYDNKFSIWNEGMLPPGLTMESLKKQHPSIPRNPIIADVCYKGGFIDTWGRGTLKIINACKEAELPEPSITEVFGGFRVEIFSSKVIGSEKSSEKSSEKIIALMRIDPQITIAQLSNSIGITTRAIEKQIEKLKNTGKIKRIGSDKEGYWELTKK
ncbi:MAG: ATP-binding protein [Ignavibacteria bacterium]|nr:ATP-binding protein [Ignavibacteria bacterium]